MKKALIKSWLVISASITALFLFQNNAQSAAIFDSLGSPEAYDNTTTDTVGPDSSSSYTASSQRVAYTFKPTSDAPPGTTDYTVRAAVFSTTSGQPTDVTFSIWRVTSNDPTTIIGSESVAKTTGNESTANILETTIPVGEVLTTANTYYLVISYSGTSGKTGTIDASNNSVHNQQISYYNTLVAPAGWHTIQGDFKPAAFSITPVPEPGAYAMIAGLGLLGFGAFRRFSR